MDLSLIYKSRHVTFDEASFPFSNTISAPVSPPPPSFSPPPIPHPISQIIPLNPPPQNPVNST